MADIIFRTLLVKGESGAITSVEKTDTNVLVDTYTITFNDGNTANFQVTNGKSISTVEKTSTRGLVDTYTITFNDNDTDTFTVTNGNGISSIEKTATNVLVDTYTITLSDGNTETFTVTNGKGISTVEKTATNGLIDTYTITYNDGSVSTFTVTNGSSSDNENLATVELHTTATKRYLSGDHIIYNGVYYEVTTNINAGELIEVGTNVEKRNIGYEITQLNRKTAGVEAGTISVNTINSTYDYTNHVYIDADKEENTSALYLGYTRAQIGKNDDSNPQYSLSIFNDGVNGSSTFWRDYTNIEDLERYAFIMSAGVPSNYAKQVQDSSNIDLKGEYDSGHGYKYTSTGNYAYAGMLDGAQEVNISLDRCGVYLLICNSYTVMSGDVYGATARLITAHANSGTPNNLQLAQTTNAPCTISVASDNVLTIKNSANTRGTQYNLIRIM